MAISKALVATLLISLLIIDLVQAHQFVKGHHSGKKIRCGAACRGRCRLASRHKICMRACRTCCARCRCVPPGTSGNQNVCPCYATMTTHGGRHKCP
ncbi:hypothetical protein V2J09_018105 [Rumex salicifolius]